MFFEKRGGIRGCWLPGTVVALGSTDPTVGDVIGGRKTIKFWDTMNLPQFNEI